MLKPIRPFENAVAAANLEVPVDERLVTLPILARAYILAIIALGTAAVSVSSLHLRFDRPEWFIALLLFVTITSAIKISLPLTRSGSSMSLSYTGTFASILILGTPAAVLLGVLGAWAQCTFRMKASNPFHRTLFSMASLAVTVTAGGLVFQTMSAGHEGFALTYLRPLVPAALVYFTLNTGLVAVAVALSTRQAFVRVWRDNFLWSAPGYFIGAALATGAAVLVEQGTYWWGILIAVPLYLTFHSYRTFLLRVEDEQAQVRHASKVQMAIVQALALAIEAKDRTSHVHLHLIQRYAAALGHAAGMEEDEIHGLMTAALLHDVGNLAVPEHILAKPGPLSYEEFQRVKIHSRVGAEILQDVPFTYPVTTLILGHHEHWDGTGYPSGLDGTAIPLGARVLAVADCFTALMAERPHRRAKSFREAIAILRQSAGSVLDPRLVETFLKILPTLEPRVRAHSSDVLAGERDKASSPGSDTALQNIAGAHLEARALYEIAQALGSSLGVADTMGLISSKLSTLIPTSCAALFIQDEQTGILACRYAAGVNEDGVRRVTGHSVDDIEVSVDAGGAAFATPDSGSNLRLQSALACKLGIEDRTLGALAVYHVGSASFTDEHRRLLERVAEQAASVIFNSLVFEQTQEASLRDPLTELPNRRHLSAHLQKELARAARRHAPLAVLLLDLDDFKAINDQHGHAAGDRALREAGLTLRSMLRPYDLCARYAGDEFVVVLSQCGVAEVDRRRRELQDAVAAVHIEVAPDRLVALSISAGAAVFPEDGSTEEELLAIADRRMYADKMARKGPIAILNSGEDDGSALR